MNKNFDLSELNKITIQELKKYGLIENNEIIKLIPTYPFFINGEWHSHYIIDCEYSKTRFFLKEYKGRDNIFLCNDYLKNRTDAFGNNEFSIVLIPLFSCNEKKYYVSNFVDGDSLDSILNRLSNKQCKKIAKEVYKLWFELTEIHSSNYSENNQFLSENAASILKNKLRDRLSHPIFYHVARTNIDRAIYKCDKILDNCSFSVPSLIHMDIKPANIIYDENTELVTIIDFEHARFGDVDYGWAQVLLSGINSFGEKYRKKIYPYLIQEYLSITDALQIPKYQCYFFYQTACNIIHYSNINEICPLTMKELFYNLLEVFSKE